MNNMAMNEIVQLITHGAEEFTPDVLVGLIVFCMFFDSMMMILGNLAKAVRR